MPRMAEDQYDQRKRQERLREQEEERRRRKVTADLRLERQERQAQDEARQSAEQPPYAQLPRYSHTGIR